MKGHGKKMIAPIVVTVLTVAYLAAYFLYVIRVTGGLLRIALGVIPAALGVAMICVCVQRIKEIRSGEEDDLGQY